MNSAEFQKEYGKRTNLRKKTKEQINKEMTTSFLRQCEQAGFPKPLCEYKFRADRRWRIDFCFIQGEEIIAVEIEGHGHSKFYNFQGDMEKYNAITFDGMGLFRFTVEQVMNGYAVKFLKDVFGT